MMSSGAWKKYCGMTRRARIDNIQRNTQDEKPTSHAIIAHFERKDLEILLIQKIHKTA